MDGDIGALTRGLFDRYREKKGKKERKKKRKRARKSEEKKNIARRLTRAALSWYLTSSERATPSHHDCCLSTRREESARVWENVSKGQRRGKGMGEGGGSEGGRERETFNWIVGCHDCRDVRAYQLENQLDIGDYDVRALLIRPLEIERRVEETER